ncbi:hypothetical protein ACGFSG_03135 [Streptomyces sp. NPDC048512]|uniref:hypothetical protein n=1 Tax=Streptomyces sp. NPDC048512 TaxID=3365563 RepID=UPI00371B1828
MDLEKPSAGPVGPPGAGAEGCLAVAIRVPVRIVVLVLVVPVRMLWDACVVGGRLLRDTVLRPLGRVVGWVARALLVWPWVALWRYLVVPLGTALAWLGRVLLVVPAVWLYRAVLTPLGHALVWCAGGVGSVLGWMYARVLTPVGHAVAALLRGIGLVLGAVGGALWTVAAWLARYLVVVPAAWLHRWVLTPVARAVVLLLTGLVWVVRMTLLGIGAVLYWTARVLLVLPALALWRWVLVPVGRALAVVGREVGEALGHAWRVAGHLSLAVGRFLGRLLTWILVDPARWAYRTVLTPVGHTVRDLVLKPAAEAARSAGRAARQALAAARDGARQARADLRRLLFGPPGEPQLAGAPESRPAPPPEPRAGAAREPDPLGPREPVVGGTRTLGSSTTALTKD